MATRSDKVRQRITAAEGGPKPEKTRKRVDSDIPKGPMSDEQQERIFDGMLSQHYSTVASWRNGFYALPGAIAALAAYMLVTHTQKPFSEEASHFLPLREDIGAGGVAFGLATIIMTCIISALANATGHKGLRYIALAVSVIPMVVLGLPFVQRPQQLLSFGPVRSMPGYKGFWSLIWLAPLAAPLVAGTHVGVEIIWDKLEAELKRWFDAYRYEHKSA